MRLVSASLCVAALAAAAPAAAVEANLDADRRLERVIRADTEPQSALGKRVVLRDRGAGRPTWRPLSASYDTVDYLRVREADGFAERPEILFELRTGGGGHVGLTSIVRYGQRGERGCVDPVRLFRYRPEEPLLEPPHGFSPANWRLKLRDYTARFRGKEVQLWEGYVTGGDPLCCPSMQRVTRFRFDADTDRYVAYWTRVRELG